MLGLVEGRTIENEAYDWVEYLDSLYAKNDNLKKGVANPETWKLLNGKLKTLPYEDQITAISYIIHNRRVGVFDTMGIGKTIQVLAATVARPEIAKTLVVCPKSVMMGFEREIQKHTYATSVSVPTGRKLALEFIKGVKGSNWNFMLIHPENLISTTTYDNEITKLLKTLVWDQVIVDEFHMYKNWTARRSKCVAAIINGSRASDGKAPRVVLMTGTPVSENPASAYMVLRLLGRDQMPHPSRFENHFCVKKKIKVGKNIQVDKIVGFKNLNELKTMIERVSIRRTKADVRGFPDQTFMIRDILLSGRQHDLYRALCGQIIKELPTQSLINVHSFLESNTKVLRLRQVMNSPALLGENGDSAKYVELDSILEELLSDPEQKVVLWTEWRAAVDLLYDRYNALYGAAKIYGGVSNQELESIRDDFETKDRPRVIVSIPAKGGVGLDFLARARTAIYLDRPRSFILYNQSLDRICRRIPPTANMSSLDVIRSRPATLMFLDVVGSVDEMIREELYGKVNFVDAVTISDETLVELGKQDLLRYLA
jgi:SNF2 family DNA or RNA helicase